MDRDQGADGEGRGDREDGEVEAKRCEIGLLRFLRFQAAVAKKYAPEAASMGLPLAGGAQEG